MVELIALTKQFGPFVAFTIFFIWTGYVRERRLSRRIDELADAQRITLTELVEKTTETLARNSLIMERNTEVIERLEETLLFLTKGK